MHFRQNISELKHVSSDNQPPQETWVSSIYGEKSLMKSDGGRN